MQKVVEELACFDEMEREPRVEKHLSDFDLSHQPHLGELGDHVV